MTIAKSGLWACAASGLWACAASAAPAHFPMVQLGASAQAPLEILMQLPRRIPALANQAPQDRDEAWRSSLFGLVDVHQQIISPTDGPRSHFYPVSSTYARAALRRFGWRGIALTFDRLMRENGERWVYARALDDGRTVKVDPLPLAIAR